MYILRSISLLLGEADPTSTYCWPVHCAHAAQLLAMRTRTHVHAHVRPHPLTAELVKLSITPTLHNALIVTFYIPCNLRTLRCLYDLGTHMSCIHTTSTCINAMHITSMMCRGLCTMVLSFYPVMLGIQWNLSSKLIFFFCIHVDGLVTALEGVKRKPLHHLKQQRQTQNLMRQAEEEKV